MTAPIGPTQLVTPFPGLAFQGLMHPGYVAGRYYLGTLMGGGAGGVAFVANLTYFSPFAVFQNRNFSALAIDVTVSGTANNAQYAVYSNVGGVPANLVVDAGLATGANPLQSTGMKPSAAACALSAGFYWMAVVLDGTATISALSANQVGLISLMGSSVDLVAPDSAITGTLAFGAFPAVAFSGAMGALTYVTTANPAVSLRA